MRDVQSVATAAGFLLPCLRWDCQHKWIDKPGCRSWDGTQGGIRVCWSLGDRRVKRSSMPPFASEKSKV